MRLFHVISMVLALSFASTAYAAEAEWIEYVNREDRFSINLPGFPTIESTIYTSEFDSPWKANRYTVNFNGYTYRMTVADMSTTSLTPDNDKYRNVARPGNERRGAVYYAAGQFRKTGKVTLDAYEELQVIPGVKLEIELPSGQTNLVEIHVHDKRLYILEIISPKGELPGFDVQSSLAILNAAGIPPRYADNDYSFPDNMQPARAFAASGVGLAQDAGPTTTRENAQSAIIDPDAPPRDTQPAPAPAPRPAQ